MAEQTRAPGSPPAEDVVPALAPVEPGARSYGHKAVADILQRAARLNRERSDQGGAELTVAELEQIARDAGIDPAAVRQAVQDFEQSQQRPFLTRLAGAPLRHTIERVVERELTVEDHEGLVAEIRTALGPLSRGAPHVSAVGRSLTVSADNAVRVIEVSLTPRAGKTTVRIAINESQLAGTLIGGFLAPVVGLSLPVLGWALEQPAGGPAGAILAGLIASLAGSYAAGRLLFARSASRVDGAMQALANSLARHVEAKPGAVAAAHPRTP